MTSKIGLMGSTPSEMFGFLNLRERDALIKIMKENRKSTPGERAMRLHMITDMSIPEVSEELNFYVAGVVNVLHKNFPGDRDTLKEAIELMMQAITEAEDKGVKL